MLSQQDLKELRKLCTEDGLNLSEDELLDAGINLLNMVKNVYQPIKKEWFENTKK